MIVVVYGPPGTGKTTLKEKLKTLFKCQHIIDGWDGVDMKALRENSLVLCQTVADENKHSPKITRIMDISYARYLVNKDANKGKGKRRNVARSTMVQI